MILDPEVLPSADGPRRRLSLLLDREGAHLREALLRHGAILLRGTSVTEPSDLQWFLQSLTRGKLRAYEGGVSPRRRVEEQVYTSTELPPHLPIALHNELSYTTRFPRHLAFLCRSRATRGGESMLADGRAVLAHLDPDVVERFERAGVRYEFKYPGQSRALSLMNRVSHGIVGKTWMDVFETGDREVAEARCRDLGLEIDRSRADEIRAHATLPATITHPQSGQRAWFNQAHLFQLTPPALGWLPYIEAKVAFLHPDFRMHRVTYGDGAPIPARVLHRVCRVLEQERVLLAMDPTDLLVIDNLLCMHGRASFRGQRRILVTMTEA